MEKWDALAQKFFRIHETDLRPPFFKRWAGKKGRFEKEIQKLKDNFLRKCSNKNTIPRPMTESKDHVNIEYATENRDRRSVAHNPGRQMKHIVRNVENWTEIYLTGCSNQEKVIGRWQKFVERWEKELAKNPIFQQEFENDERYLRHDIQPGRPCGQIFSEFGLRGRKMELNDASVDMSNGIDNLGDTYFGNDELMSMVPYAGKLYQETVPHLYINLRMLHSSL